MSVTYLKFYDTENFQQMLEISTEWEKKFKVKKYQRSVSAIVREI